MARISSVDGCACLALIAVLSATSPVHAQEYEYSGTCTWSHSGTEPESQWKDVYPCTASVGVFAPFGITEFDL